MQTKHAFELLARAFPTGTIIQISRDTHWWRGADGGRWSTQHYTVTARCPAIGFGVLTGKGTRAGRIIAEDLEDAVARTIERFRRWQQQQRRPVAHRVTPAAPAVPVAAHQFAFAS